MAKNNEEREEVQEEPKKKGKLFGDPIFELDEW